MSNASRREVLRRGLVGAVLPTWWGRLAPSSVARGDDLAATPGLIVRSSLPLDAETPVEAFDRFLTPNDIFFVRSHFGPPATTLAPWRFEVDGLVDRPLALGLDELKDKFESVTIPAVLQCSGNGRAYFKPTIPGVGWDRGAVGNAEWTGVRLLDILRAAGIKPDAAHVHLHGADLPPHPNTPAYFRSIPLARAVDPGTIVATAMNGQPLPRLHGGPLRLVVPGWAGNHWIKWLRKVTVSRDEAPGFYMQTGYKIPKVPTPPDVVLKPTDVVPVTTLNVKSLIARAPRRRPPRPWPGGDPRRRLDRRWRGRAGGSPDRPRPALAGGQARRPCHPRDLADLDPRLGRPRGPAHPPRPRHRLPWRDPARNHPLEPERLPLERDRPGHLRGRLT